MTTRRVILEESDDKPQPSLPNEVPDNFSAFANGFQEGIAIKGLLKSLITLAIIIWIIWLIV